MDKVKNAYKNTSLGSFVKTVTDVHNSEWLALDHDDEDGIDVAIFFRLPRSNENWVGKKIQGIGHDGTEQSKLCKNFRVYWIRIHGGLKLLDYYL